MESYMGGFCNFMVWTILTGGWPCNVAHYYSIKYLKTIMCLMLYPIVRGWNIHPQQNNQHCKKHFGPLITHLNFPALCETNSLFQKTKQLNKLLWDNNYCFTSLLNNKMTPKPSRWADQLTVEPSFAKMFGQREHSKKKNTLISSQELIKVLLPCWQLTFDSQVWRVKQNHCWGSVCRMASHRDPMIEWLERGRSKNRAKEVCCSN